MMRRADSWMSCERLPEGMRCRPGVCYVRALYDGLSELEAQMHIHVHLENNILFPRALALAEPAAPHS